MKFKTDGLLLWPIYVSFTLEDWKHYETEYAEQANLVTSNIVMINSISKNPDSCGGTFHFINGKLINEPMYNSEDIYIVEV